MDASALSSFNAAMVGGLSDFSVANLGTVILAAVGLAVPLVIAWFAWRFISRKASGAMRKGKL